MHLGRRDQHVVAVDAGGEGRDVAVTLDVDVDPPTHLSDARRPGNGAALRLQPRRLAGHLAEPTQGEQAADLGVVRARVPLRQVVLHQRLGEHLADGGQRGLAAVADDEREAHRQRVVRGTQRGRTGQRDDEERENDGAGDRLHEGLRAAGGGSTT